MTTPSHALRETIIEALSAADPQPVRLQEIYRAVEQRLSFDVEDLTSTDRSRRTGQ